MPSPHKKLAIVIMGVSGSGKSTIGSLLARQLGTTLIEGDALHSRENVAKMAAGIPLDDADRWPWLDRVGYAITGELETRETVVAACSALKRAYRDRLERVIGPALRFVLLEVDREVLLRRLTHRPHHFMPASLLESQLDTLEPPGVDEPAIIVQSSNASPEEIARVIDMELVDRAQ